MAHHNSRPETAPSRVRSSPALGGTGNGQHSPRLCVPSLAHGPSFRVQPVLAHWPPMPMKPAIQALVQRVLAAREDTARAALAGAVREAASRAHAMLTEQQAMAQETARAAAFAAGPMAGLSLDSWRAAAAAGLATHHNSLMAAEAACELSRTTLADAARARRAFDALLATEAEQRQRDARRHDPLAALLLLPRTGP